MTQKFSTKTPIKLQDHVFAAVTKAYRGMIETHGASYTVNRLIVEHLRSCGVSIADPETKEERIAKGQARRWKSVKAADAEAGAKVEARRELKRKRDERYRQKKKKAAQGSTPEE